MMMPQCSFGVEFIKFLGQASVICAGWFVVNRLANIRDNDNSRRAMVAETIDLLCKSVDDLFAQSYAYHTSDRDSKEEARIKMGLQDLSHSISSLKMIALEDEALKKCYSSFITFKRALTISHFEDEHECPLKNNDPQLDVIAQETLSLKRGLVDLKHAQFSLNNNNSLFGFSWT